MKSKKFMEFSPVDKKTWIDQAIRDINGRDFEQTLFTKVMEGFSLSPFYTAEDAQTCKWVKSYENRFYSESKIPLKSPKVWVNVVEIIRGQELYMNREIRSVLNKGADGIIVGLTGREDLSLVFQGVLPECIQIWIKPLGDPMASLKSFLDWASDQSIHHLNINGGMFWDGMVKGFEQRIELDKQMEEILILFELCIPYPNFKSICLDTSVYQNAGATSVQELGYGMAAFVELMDGLTERGAKPEGIIKDIFICTAVGSHYFMEIAKLKTFRIGFQQLAGLYQVALNPEDVFLFSKSSRWSKSSLEPDNNLVRNTAEAMSSIIGGCNTLFIEPHDKWQKEPEEFSQRIARNISIILKEECFFDKVLDPAAGSYYLECLIHALHKHSFQLLTTVEKNGGWWRSYLDNNIQEEIKKIRKEKFSQVLTDSPSMTGIAPKLDSLEEAYQLKSFSHSFHLENSL